MRTISLKHIVFALAGVITISVSAVPSVTPKFSTSLAEGGETVESMPGIVTPTGSLTLPSGISEAPGPVIPPTTGSGDSTSTSGTFSVSTASSSTINSTTTGTTSSPASSTSTGAGILSRSSSDILLAGLLALSAAGVHLL